MLKKKQHMLLLHHKVMQPISSSTNSFMAPILLLFFSELYVLSLLLHPTHAMISLGSSLSPTTKPASWLSPTGLFAFGFYNQGNGFAVGIWLATSSNKTIVWTANRDDPPVPPSTKLLLTEGGLLVQTPGSPDKNISGHIPSPASSASLLDSGNFVLYNSSSDIIWETFDFPTDTILAGQQLSPGNQLVSSISDTNHSTGWFRIKMQEDGNLVSYPVGTYDTGDNAYWASYTDGMRKTMFLYLNISGSISLINSSNFLIEKQLEAPVSSSSGTTVYRATLDTDGIFRRYSHTFGSYESIDVTPSNSEEDCKDKCLGDCLCGAAMFDGQNCNKLKIPLKFGRRDTFGSYDL